MAGCRGAYIVPFTVQDVATEKKYGYDRDQPVKVGGAVEGQSKRHVEAFFRSLRGPAGQPVSFVGNGTCCTFLLDPESKGRGRLEIYLVSYPGIPNPVILYLDTYHLDKPRAPIGFEIAPSPSQPGP